MKTAVNYRLTTTAMRRPTPPRAFTGSDNPNDGNRSLQTTKPVNRPPMEWEQRRYSLKAAEERPLPKELPEGLSAPSLSVSVDREHPEGTISPAPHMTVLQGHVAFFDADGDGIIYPADTYRGFRRVGFGRVLSTAAAFAIHSAQSAPTLPREKGFLFFPPFDIRFPIYVDNIHQAKHGSDSEVYDTEGRWITAKFEEIWSKYDKDNTGTLVLDEMKRMINVNRNTFDFFGQSAAFLEWQVTFALAAREVDGQKVLFKDDVRGVLDGTLFYAKEAELQRDAKNNSR